MKLFVGWQKILKGSSPLWGIMGLALVLRLVMVGSRGLQYDDAFSIFLSRRSLSEIVAGTAADTMPPLYYFLLHYWLLINQSVWFIRLLTIAISLGLVAVLFWLAEQWFDRKAAAWAGLIAAISPLHLYHAQDIRMYALLVLGQSGFAAFFTRIWFAEQGRYPKRVWDWAGLIFSGLVAMYSHNLAIFGLIPVFLFLILYRRWKLFWRMVAAQVAILFGALPWLFLLPGQLQKIQNAFWTPRPGLVEIIQALILFTSTLPLPPLILAVVAVLSFQVLVIMILEIRKNIISCPGSVFFLCLMLVPPLLLFIVSYEMRPVFVTRGFLVSSLAFYALVGFTAAQSWSRGIGKIVMGASILIALISMPYYFSFRSFPRSPVDEAMTYLKTIVQPGDLIVHETKLSYFPAHFYAAYLTQVFVADIPGSENDTFAPASQRAMNIYPQPDLATAVGESNRVFFVTYSQVFSEYQAAGLSEDPAIQWLEERYHLQDHRKFNDLEVFTFSR